VGTSILVLTLFRRFRFWKEVTNKLDRIDNLMLWVCPKELVARNGFQAIFKELAQKQLR
jgi:hypothetical protein